MTPNNYYAVAICFKRNSDTVEKYAKNELSSNRILADKLYILEHDSHDFLDDLETKPYYAAACYDVEGCCQARGE
jgi:hypothetical protein